MAGCLCFIFILAGFVEADVALTVSGLRGGLTIDLGQLDGTRRTTQEEVTIQVSNTASAQYQLLQFLSSPLVSERGATIDPAAITLEISGGDSGTVRFHGAAAMPEGTAEVFTSNANGQAETLRLLYGMIAGTLPQAGTYQGAITYTLRAIDGSSLKTVTVPIRLLVNPAVSLTVADDSTDRVRFEGMEPGQVSIQKSVSLRITQNTLEPLQLIQNIKEPLANEQGEALPFSALTVGVSSDHGVTQEIAIAPRVTLLADQSGSAITHRVELTYGVVVPPDQRAGVYRGTLLLALEGAAVIDNSEAVTMQVPIELEVLPILSLALTSELGDRLDLMFSNLRGGETSPPQTIQFQVASNTGKSYGVFQELSRVLVSDEGHQLPEESFFWTGGGQVKGGGALQVLQERAVPLGKNLIYRSDPVGTPARFSVSYTVRIPQYTPAGTYKTTLLFTVTTL